ncbi:ribosomal subunit 39S-domain-containing protein [Bisporella sp. PMI_857]|nr:ribosomal subunit 39S-domain-containing protein [Bisporella sp. PMI_857]
MMRRISRIERPIGLIRAGTSAPPISRCATCKHQATSFSTCSTRNAVFDTEKIRKKIWGTDEPPGLKDPYGGESVVERIRKSTRSGKSNEGGEGIEEQTETDSHGYLKRKGRKVSSSKTNKQPMSKKWVQKIAMGKFAQMLVHDPPQKHYFAPEDVSESSSYTPAETWHGLEEVGGPTEPKYHFQGFMSRNIIEDNEVLEATLHRAMVEVFNALKTKKPLDVVYAIRPDLSHTTDFVQITPSKTSAESEENIAVDRSAVDLLQTETQTFDTYEELIASWDPSWKQITLADPKIKFAVIKRTMQLTGKRIPDSALRSIHNAQSLLNELITPPKPKTLIEVLAQKEDLLTLPNVSVYPKLSFEDKEKMVGRWKVIEKELRERGLPVHDRPGRGAN